MARIVLVGLGIALATAWMAAGPARAQTHDHMHMPGHTTSTPDSTQRTSKPSHEHAQHEAMTGHAHHQAMTGLYGPYSMTREASGTSWQADRSRHQGVHATRGDWMLMLHGTADLAYDHQGGPRGDEKTFSSNMLMGMARRSAGPGTLGLRAMLSLEPATIGKEGYPLLLQTGETADGETPLIDRQHPHDLFMELAASYSISRGNRSAFLYGGLPGEPALGPPAFMHRFSGMSIPLAPISHHWLDSSHITFGVLTLGAVLGSVKLEASAFRGREPDQHRYDIESPKLDSHSFRFSWNPTVSWALQTSYGRLHRPEQLEPDVDQDRWTASAIHAADWNAGHWETTLAWGRNKSRPGPELDAVTLESAVQLERKHTLFGRAEWVEKDELFQEGDPREGNVYGVGEVSAGYRYDFWTRQHVATGIGVLGTISFVPGDIEGVYDGDPVSGVIFAHLELR
jgi:hypothetical protein